MHSERQSTVSKTRQVIAATQPKRHDEHAFYRRCIDILRCTAHALNNSPGGLRYRAGSQPWLEGLCGNARVAARS